MSAKPRGQGLGAWGVDIEHRAGGEMIVRADVALGAYPDFITDRLEHWARVTPDQLFLAERGPDDVWREVTYAQALTAVRALGQALLDHDLGQDRPLAILSANDIDQALLTLAAQYVGVPAAPVSPPYSLIAEDFQRLARVLEQIGPGLAFVAQGEPFAAAVTAATPPDLPVVVGSGAIAGRRTTPLAQLMATIPTEAVDRRRDARRPDEIAKILFTSGSTGVPKGVINTHRMLASNQQMLRQAFAFAEHAPPVMLDWLPWHHTFGGNHNFGFALYNGGSFYIDDGRPTPGGIDRTVRNIKAVRPTVYLNVPRGFDLLLPRMARDAALTQALFERLEFLFYSGASLSAATWNGLRAASHAAGVGGLPIVTSLGATETAPACLVSLHEAEGPGEIGVPAPGVEVKLVPAGAKLELRLRGPHVTPGYWRRPELTASAFDEEGFYRIGDALSFLDVGRPERGFRFDGRLAEDFKLSTGAWVDVGRLRARTMAALAPLVADVVIVGADRGDVGALLLPAWDACRAWIGEACDAPLDHPRLRRHLQDRLAAMEARGSSERLIRAAFLREPLSLAAGEVTDKGSINARTVADRRSALVDALYANPERVGAVVLRSVAAG